MRFLFHGFALAVSLLSPSITDPLEYTHTIYQPEANSTEPHVRLVLTDSFPTPLLFLCSRCASNTVSIATDPSHGDSFRQGCEHAPESYRAFH
ncbi:hypothetical protein BGY98DRAFT_962337, partial [Russula aff. rugulosa BPL654]